MLLQQFRSFYKYSGQGFESSHKLHRQLYSRATNHDASGPGQSLDEILTHWYATMLMSIRYAFHEARDCITLGVPKEALIFYIMGKKRFSFLGVVGKPLIQHPGQTKKSSGFR
ncbi:uncharacterized protein [Montipora foliosa]|uniref:uncharacterized protein n=1 Tax=Montipora foliosa TaxID=591990 RepID=UPI0035F19462